MKEHVVEQRTDQWQKLRLGMPTASNFHRIISNTTGKKLAAARDYLCELVYEKTTGKFYRKDLSGIKAVQDGIRLEPKAVEEFEKLTRLKTRPVGFITDDNMRIGCSPDRLIAGSNQAVEVKCPTGPKHILYTAFSLNENYRAQIQGQIMIGGYEGVHFVSYNEEFALYHEYVRPDQKFITAMGTYLTEFTVELIRVTDYMRRWGVFPKDAVLPNFPREDESDDGFGV